LACCSRSLARPPAYRGTPGRCPSRHSWSPPVVASVPAGSSSLRRRHGPFTAARSDPSSAAVVASPSTAACACPRSPLFAVVAASARPSSFAGAGAALLCCRPVQAVRPCSALLVFCRKERGRCSALLGALLCCAAEKVPCCCLCALLCCAAEKVPCCLCY